MKAAQINTYGNSDVIEINSDAPTPALADDSILVEVRAAGVNPIDWKIREGYMQEMMPLRFPATLGGDFAGVVTEVGKDVSGIKPGDEVYGQAPVIGGGSGSFAEVLSAKAASVALKPKNVEHTEAAALPLAGVSALQALTEHLQLAKDQKVLIHGGAGGIGSMAVQLAKHLGAYVATTVKKKDADYAKGLGADEVIDYENQSFEEILHDYDAVFDTVGDDTYTKSFSVLRRGGMIVSMVAPANEELMKKHDVTAIAQGTQTTTEGLTKLSELVEQGALTAHVDKVFSLNETTAALDHLQADKVQGKVVIKIS